MIRRRENIPTDELPATNTFPPLSIKLVIAATSSDPPNSIMKMIHSYLTLFDLKPFYKYLFLKRI